MHTQAIHQAQGSGRWFDADGTHLRREIIQYLAAADVRLPEQARVIAAVAPHAGYLYSGAIAGHAYSALEQHAVRCGAPDVAVVLGISHSGMTGGVALLDGAALATPLGHAALSQECGDFLCRQEAGFYWDAQVHVGEHSVENQVPFLQVALPETPLVLGLVGTHDVVARTRVSEALSALACTKRVLVIASSDMLHDPSEERVRTTDERTCGMLSAMDSDGLLQSWSYTHQVLCGIAPTAMAMEYARAQGVTCGQVLAYGTSADVSPECRGQWVVGYGAVVFAKTRA